MPETPEVPKRPVTVERGGVVNAYRFHESVRIDAHVSAVIAKLNRYFTIDRAGFTRQAALRHEPGTGAEYTLGELHLPAGMWRETVETIFAILRREGIADIQTGTMEYPSHQEELDRQREEYNRQHGYVVSFTPGKEPDIVTYTYARDDEADRQRQSAIARGEQPKA